MVLVGTGADERFGGYGRHRSAFTAAGGNDGPWLRLARELAVDGRRLWLRNLGRDDRATAAAGREARHPFLDEAVAAAVAATPLPVIMDPRLPHGVGDKRALRAAAAAAGAAGAAALVKRAMHFGTRLARQANVAAFGSNSAAAGGAAAVGEEWWAAVDDGGAGGDGAGGGE